jgi:hypothetical protein
MEGWWGLEPHLPQTNKHTTLQLCLKDVILFHQELGWHKDQSEVNVTLHIKDNASYSCEILVSFVPDYLVRFFRLHFYSKIRCIPNLVSGSIFNSISKRSNHILS